MAEHTTDDPDSKRKPPERYRYVEYEHGDGSVSVIQDTQNDQAWIQSTHVVSVER